MDIENQDDGAPAQADAPVSVFQTLASSFQRDGDSQRPEPAEVVLGGQRGTVYFIAARDAEFQALMIGQGAGAKPDEAAKARARFIVQTLREADGSRPRTPEGREFSIKDALALKAQATAALVGAALKVSGFGKEAEEATGKGSTS